MKLLFEASFTYNTPIPGPVGAVQYPTDPDAQAQLAANNIVPFANSNSQPSSRKVIDYRHPDYNSMRNSWVIFRDAWKGGQDFTDKYMQVFSKREDPMDLAARKKYSYCPAISKGAVITIKNAISQRMGEVSRKGGSVSYQTAQNGDKWGVDKLGSSMNTFVAKEVMPEMLAMGKVGVYIDRPQLQDHFTQMDTLDKRPYIYIFKCEDILAWVHDDSHEPNQFKTLLLREHFLITDPINDLPIQWVNRFRYLRAIKDENGSTTHIEVKFFDARGKQIDLNGVESPNVKYELDMQVIPFVLFELSESLLTDVAAYQIALLNMASSDVSYSLKSNFPFYTEQYDPRSEPGPYKTGIVPENKLNKDSAIVNQIRKSIKDDAAKEEVQVGVSSGRRYPVGTQAPSFIAPPTEPLMASIQKQNQLKEEIQQILNLWLSNVTAGSVDLENQDKRQGLESGLNNIGMELEHGERRLAHIWDMYEGTDDIPNISYPKTYSIKTDSERIQEAKDLADRRSDIPSVAFQKEISKQEVAILFSGKIDAATIQKMQDEIDQAKTMTCDVDQISTDLQNGLVGEELASLARGYPKGEVINAREDHANRIARVQKAQQANGMLKNPGSRGIIDQQVDPKDAKKEKTASKIDASGTIDQTATRGEAENRPPDN